MILFNRNTTRSVTTRVAKSNYVVVGTNARVPKLHFKIKLLLNAPLRRLKEFDVFPLLTKHPQETVNSLPAGTTKKRVEFLAFVGEESYYIFVYLFNFVGWISANA